MSNLEEWISENADQDFSQIRRNDSVEEEEKVMPNEIGMYDEPKFENKISGSIISEVNSPDKSSEKSLFSKMIGAI